ncbi:ribbon-helix-helix protein, CopG family [Candidatus Pacearchaeota archaeon]|nr:ribbon-helix-helix protein, CopG family [Candidatus Pacearchaeota archaeon]
MKKKLSISVEEKTIEIIENLIKNSRFRNKSHVVELALEKLMEEENERS